MLRQFKFFLKKTATLSLIGLIVVYQKCISAFIPARCRFLPTCSTYGIEAIKAHGALKGLVLLLKRLGKCHPITFLGASSGFDPVPPKKKKIVKEKREKDATTR